MEKKGFFIKFISYVAGRQNHFWRHFIPGYLCSGWCLMIAMLHIGLFASLAEANVEIVRDRSSGRVVAIKPDRVEGATVFSNADPSESANSFLEKNKATLGIKNTAAELKMIPFDPDYLGMSHIRYEQFHKELPVIGAEVVVHISQDGTVAFVSVGLADRLPDNVDPSVSSTTAQEIAFKEASASVPLIAHPAELVLLPLGLLRNSQNDDTQLAWKVKITDKEKKGVFSKDYYISAIDKSLLLVLSNSDTLDRSAWDCGMEPGNGNCYLDEYSATYDYYFGRSESAPERGPSPTMFYPPEEDYAKAMIKEVSIPNSAEILPSIFDTDLINKKQLFKPSSSNRAYETKSDSKSSSSDARDTATVFSKEQGSELTRDLEPSLDIDHLHTLLGQTQAFVQETFGINGANNAGGSAVTTYGGRDSDESRGYAHWQNTGAAMCPGGAEFMHDTGDMHFCLEMTAPDTIGHEYAHAVVFHSYHNVWGEPIGIISSGQTGSLNEGHSEYMGEVFENFATGTTDWKAGTGSAWTVLFDLSDPGSTGYIPPGGEPAVPNPERWMSRYVVCDPEFDDGGVHINGSIISHMFWRMANGGGQNGCYIESIGSDAAAQIFFRSWRENYLTRTVTFNQAYSAFLQVCSELYSSEVCEQVRISLEASELDQPGYCSGQPEVAPNCPLQTIDWADTYIQDWTTGQILLVSDYVLGETGVIRGCGGVPGRETTATWRVQYSTAIPNGYEWWKMKGTYGAHYTVTPIFDENGCFSGTLPEPFQRYSSYIDYAVYIDSDNDGRWQNWSDYAISHIPLLSTVNHSDGICRRVGGSAATTENCYSYPTECPCAQNTTCLDTEPGSGKYACVSTVNNAGTIYSARPNGVTTSLFALNENVFVKGESGVAGSTVDIYLEDHIENRTNWSPINSSIMLQAVVQPDGQFLLPLNQASSVGYFDIIADGNRDGIYDQWSDSYVTFEVRQPVDGDGMCYLGESYPTSENCHDSPQDCGCQSGYQCLDTNPGQDTIYGCVRIPNNCFLAGTRITMSDTSTKAIEDIEVGDTVLSFDETSGKFVTGYVNALRRDNTSEYVILNGNTKVTSNHRFYVPRVIKAGSVNASLPEQPSAEQFAGGEWKEIGQLKPGTMLLDQSGTLIEIKSIEKIKETAPVFNFEVSPNPAYVADGMVVHNRKIRYQMQAVGDGQPD